MVMFIKNYKLFLLRRLVFVTSALLLILILLTPKIVLSFDCGTYNSGAFGEGQVCDDTAQNNSGQKDSGLINTGQAIAYTVPAIMILSGVLIIYRSSRKRKNKYTKK